MTYHHIGLEVRKLLTLPDLSPIIRQCLEHELDLGHEISPIGNSFCLQWDYLTGCPGHPEDTYILNHPKMGRVVASGVRQSP